jgi:hypothetical protein
MSLQWGTLHRPPRLQRICAVGVVVAGAGLIGAVPVRLPALLNPAPVVQVHDVTLVSGVDPTAFITSLELVVVDALREGARAADLSQLTVPQVLDDFGLGGLTPNELLSFTGLGNVTLNDLAGFLYLGANPLSVLLAATGLSDATTLSQAVDNLGLDDQPLSSLESLFGLSANDTLSQVAGILGVGNQPISNLWDLIGLNADSTLNQTADTLGINNTDVGTLLGDWGVGPMNINNFLHGLDVSPSQLLSILGIQPSALGSLWDPSTVTFTAGTTVQQFADTAGLGDDTVTQLLSVPGTGDATLSDAATTIGLNGGAGTVEDTLKTISFDDLSLAGFLSGFGLTSGSPISDLYANIPGFDNATIGGLLDAFGLSDQSTISQLLDNFGGLDDTTLSGLVTDLGIGNNTAFELASNLLGGATVDQYFTQREQLVHHAVGHQVEVRYRRLRLGEPPRDHPPHRRVRDERRLS